MFNFSTVFFVTILCAAPGTTKGKDTVMKRYHPILVVIHWVMLVLIVMAMDLGSICAGTYTQFGQEKLMHCGCI